MFKFRRDGCYANDRGISNNGVDDRRRREHDCHRLPGLRKVENENQWVIPAPNSARSFQILLLISVPICFKERKKVISGIDKPEFLYILLIVISNKCSYKNIAREIKRKGD